MLKWITGVEVSDFKNLKKNLELVGSEIVQTLTAELLSADKVASRKLLNSLNSEVLETMDGFLLSISFMNYLDVIDKGRRAGAKRPPIIEIEKWATVKGIRPINGNMKKLSFAIATKISNDGIKPLNIKEKTILSILEKKKSLLESGLKIDLEQQLKKLLS